MYGTAGWSSSYAGIPAVLWLPYGCTTNAGSITITSYSGPNNGGITIPPFFDGLPVASIGSGVFVNFAGTGINIPAGVTNIGNEAFAYCEGITNLTVPGSVISIGMYAFETCTSLTNVVTIW